MAAFFVFLGVSGLGEESPAPTPSVVALQEDFSQYPSGIWMGAIGAEAEYHYLPQVSRTGSWAVSTYRSEPESQRAWRIEEWDGAPVLAMEYENKWEETHPMVEAGDPLWQDYTVSVSWTPLSDKGQSGVIFRYQNDRCYYFLGVSGDHGILKYVRDGDAFRKPHEEVLAEARLDWKPGNRVHAEATVKGNTIHGRLADATLDARHDAFGQGKIALTADAPTRFHEVTVSMSPESKVAFEKAVLDREAALKDLQARNPKAVLWKKASTSGFGVGRNLRFGDLNADGQQDVLVCQPVHHGPKDSGSEVSCLTAMTFDGEILWRSGTPDPWKTHLTNDVAFQIHDINGDGLNEIIYCRDMELIIAERATGP